MVWRVQLAAAARAVAEDLRLRGAGEEMAGGAGDEARVGGGHMPAISANTPVIPAKAGIQWRCIGRHCVALSEPTNDAGFPLSRERRSSGTVPSAHTTRDQITCGSNVDAIA